MQYCWREEDGDGWGAVGAQRTGALSQNGEQETDVYVDLLSSANQSRGEGEEVDGIQDRGNRGPGVLCLTKNMAM